MSWSGAGVWLSRGGGGCGHPRNAQQKKQHDEQKGADKWPKLGSDESGGWHTGYKPQKKGSQWPKETGDWQTGYKPQEKGSKGTKEWGVA